MPAGRKRIPIEQHKTSGTYRKHRHAAATGTGEAGELPEAPETLTVEAQAAWKRFSALLARRRVLTFADGAALEVLSETYVEWVELKRDVEQQGRTYECQTPTGRMIRANPKVAMLSDAQRRLNASLAEFGLTAASRGKIPSLSDPKATNRFGKL